MQSRRRTWPGMLMLALLVTTACGSGDDAPDTDAGEQVEADATSGEPGLSCDPETAAEGELCDCAARIVCDNIHFCLSAVELAEKPAEWSPAASCVAEVTEDCMEDGPENLPQDFRQCIADMGAASCEDYGDFGSVQEDFPASCDNFRALDTGLSIDQ